VDASNCTQKWWSDEAETHADLEVRLRSLWRQLLVEDTEETCVLVTHSNLIKAMLMQFTETEAAITSPCSGDRPDQVSSSAWQVVSSDSDSLRQLKIDRLQNCGVLGLRCVMDGYRCETLSDDEWVNVAASESSSSFTEVDFRHQEPQWWIRDAMLMFDTALVK